MFIRSENFVSSGSFSPHLWGNLAAAFEHRVKAEGQDYLLSSQRASTGGTGTPASARAFRILPGRERGTRESVLEGQCWRQTHHITVLSFKDTKIMWQGGSHAEHTHIFPWPRAPHLSHTLENKGRSQRIPPTCPAPLAQQSAAGPPSPVFPWDRRA